MTSVATKEEFIVYDLKDKRRILMTIFDALVDHNSHTTTIKENLTKNPELFDDSLCDDLYRECLSVMAYNQESDKIKFQNNFSACQQRIKNIQQQEKTEESVVDIDSLLKTID